MKDNRFTFILRLLFISVLAFTGLNCQSARPSTTSDQTTAEVVQLKETKVTFVAVGDMMLSRGVNRAITRAGDPLLPFRKLDTLLKESDFNFGNLESPISGNDNIVGKGLVFNAHTRDTLGLNAYNFKVLNLANNHALDQRLTGLQNTRRFLDERGITYLGVGDNMEQAWQPKFITVNGMNIGFIGASYASVNDGGVARNDYVARMEDTAYLRKAIAKIRPQVDFLVVTMHAGIEYTRRPNKGQVDFAHAAIDAGADMVIGAHPHWVQVKEEYRGKYIFYSLGNFVFDQEWSRDTKEGLALKITLRNTEGAAASSNLSPSKTLKKLQTRAQVEQIEMIPVVIENYSTPRMATEPEAEAILRKIGEPTSVLKPQKN